MDTYTFEQFKQLAKSLLDKAPTATPEGLQNGLKMFNLGFLQLHPDTSKLDRYQAEIVLTLVHRELDTILALC